MKNAGRGEIHVMRRAESECALVGPSRGVCWLGWEVAGCGCALAGCNFVLFLATAVLILVVVYLFCAYFGCGPAIPAVILLILCPLHLSIFPTHAKILSKTSL